MPAVGNSSSRKAASSKSKSVGRVQYGRLGAKKTGPMSAVAKPARMLGANTNTATWTAKSADKQGTKSDLQPKLPRR